MLTDLLVKTLIAILPVISLVVVLYRLETHRLLEIRFMLLVFLSGAGIAVACAFINSAVLDLVTVSFDDFTRYVAPLIEESLKAAVVIYLFRRNRIGFLVDACIVGFTVGAGFALAENVFYLSHASDAHHGVWIVRGFGTAIMHGGATALFAIITEILTDRHLRMSPVYYLPGLVAAYLLHSVFNHFPVSPVLAALATLLTLPTILFLLLERNEAAMHDFLETDFDAHRRLLDQVRNGELSGCAAGRFLRDMQQKLSAPAAREMTEYFCLHTELVLSAEQMLLAREEGIDAEPDTRTRQQLERMHALETHIGRAGLHALRPHLRFSAKDMWEVHLLERSIAHSHT